jgi:hypothetical protein
LGLVDLRQKFALCCQNRIAVMFTSWRHRQIVIGLIVVTPAVYLAAAVGWMLRLY